MNYVDKLYHSSYLEPELESSSMAAVAAAGLASSQLESSTPRLCPTHRHWTSPQPRAGLGWAPPPAAVALAAVLAQRACGEWRTRAVRAPPGSRVPQTRAAPEKRFSCYIHKPRGGRKGRCHPEEDPAKERVARDLEGAKKRGRVLSSATRALLSLTL